MLDPTMRFSFVRAALALALLAGAVVGLALTFRHTAARRPTPLSSAQRAACAQLLSALPRELDGTPLTRTPQAGTVRYGPVSVTCDAHRPPELRRDSQLFLIAGPRNGSVLWIPEARRGVFTAVDRLPFIHVSTSNSSVPPLPELSDAIAFALPPECLSAQDKITSSTSPLPDCGAYSH